jgi:two-component system NtrC family sensor kinase
VAKIIDPRVLFEGKLRLLYSYRSKLIASLLIVSFLAGTVSMVVGVQIFYKSVINEATIRVSMNLNASNEIFHNRTRLISVALNVTTLGYGFITALKEQENSELVQRIYKMAQYAELDFAGIVKKDGSTLCRFGPDPVPERKTRLSNPLTEYAIETGSPVSGAVILTDDFLLNENPDLAARAKIPTVLPYDSNDNIQPVVSNGIVLAAAVPVFDKGDLIGVLYGGILLNRGHSVVDSVADIVFRGEMYNGHLFGVVSIFFNDIRISTNVFNPDGTRAIGTKVSNNVKNHVLRRGDIWTDRASVLGNRYITAYGPINDILGKRVGMLGLGVLEQKYTDIKRRALLFFIFITIGGMIIAICIGYLLAHKITIPVRRLIKASRQVSQGSLTPDIGPTSKGEIGVLQNTFMEMVRAMGRRRAESQNRLIDSEKQASVGRLAAGIAHEINNPLTGVLSYTYMLLKRKDLDDEAKSDLKIIAKATERVRDIVKGLLDFSRQTALVREMSDINRIVNSAILLLENEALIKGVTLEHKPGNGLPSLTLDRNQIQSALLNIMINALDATEPGGVITVTTQNSSIQGSKGIDILIKDTGSGIPQDNLDKLFDPFYTTKEPGKGTGLGLAVSLGIVQRHGGTITATSELGKGTQFRVWLPLDEGNETNESIDR